MNNEENIENDHFRGTNPFRTDSDYFDDFSAKLNDRIADLDEIMFEAPVLSSIPVYNPFEVPANYFEELPSIVQEKVVNGKPSTSIIEWLALLIKPRFAIPVLTVVLIAFAGIHYINKSTEKIVAPIAEETTVEEQLQNIDETTIADALDDQTETAETTTDNDNEHIKDYLIENHIDETNLNTEL